MAGFNKVLLMGFLTRDPQLSYTPSQTPVTDFGIAINRKFTAQDGSQRDEVCFIDCRAFGNTADTINKFFDKGNAIFVEGRLDFNQWTAKDGTKHSKHRVVVERFYFLPGGNRSNDQDQGGHQDQSGYGSQSQGSSVPDVDSEIPF